MAFIRTALVLAVLACISYVRAESHEDLSPLVATTEEKLKNATTHLNHMLTLDPLPNQDKIQSLLKNESAHLIYELKKFAGQLQDSIKEGEHQPAVADGVTAAAAKLNEAAATLEHVGSDLKQDNTHYLAAAEQWLHALKQVQQTGPCDKVSPILKASLHELSHDVDNYQWGVHHEVGAHEGTPHQEGHHHHGEGGHHVHQHHGSSSEESHESHESKEHNHHHH